MCCRLRSIGVFRDPTRFEVDLPLRSQSGAARKAPWAGHLGRCRPGTMRGSGPQDAVRGRFFALGGEPAQKVWDVSLCIEVLLQDRPQEKSEGMRSWWMFGPDFTLHKLSAIRSFFCAENELRWEGEFLCACVCYPNVVIHHFDFTTCNGKTKEGWLAQLGNRVDVGFESC